MRTNWGNTTAKDGKILQLAQILYHPHIEPTAHPSAVKKLLETEDQLIREYQAWRAFRRSIRLIFKK